MKRNYRASVRAEALSTRTIVHRLLLGVLLLASFVLLLDAREPEGKARVLENSLADGASPVVTAVGNPMQAVREAIASFHQFMAANKENLVLRQEVEELRAMKIEVAELRNDNAELRRQLNSMPHLASHYLTARLLTDFRGSFHHSAIINAGALQGVQKGQAVVSADGVVGRILQVGQTSSRVLFLTDNYSKIPVITEHSSQHAIVAGNNNDMPTLRFVSSMKGLEVGEKLVTSGAGGMFPRGLPVGVVKEIRPEGVVRVQPLAPLNTLNYVSVVQQPAIAEPEENPVPDEQPAVASPAAPVAAHAAPPATPPAPKKPAAAIE